MTTLRTTVALLVAATSLTCAATDAPPTGDAASNRSCAWRVTSATTSVTLLGSIHALAGDPLPLPPAVESAFAAADTVVFEVDLDALDDAALSMVARASLPAGQTLADVVAPETLAQVTKRLAAVGLDKAGFDRMKPWMVALTLMSFELVKAGFDPAKGIDALTFEQARAAGKTIAALETVDFQLSLFDQLSAEQQEQFLLYTLAELDDAGELLKEVTELWRNGQTDRLTELLDDGFADYPDLEKRIVSDRNAKWLNEIERYLAGDRPHLVVVGALHLVGDKGLVAVLRARGFEVTQL